MSRYNPFALVATLVFWPFLPNYRVNVVNELKPAVLHELGIQYIMLDVDCTLKRYDSDHLEDWVLEWLKSLKSTGIEVCLLSNGNTQRIGKLAEKYELQYEAMALKPLPFGCFRVMRRNNWDRKHTAMVGDQLFADVAAGKLAGVTTIHVTPIHPEMEPIFTRVKRPLERLVFHLIPMHKISEP